MPRSTKVLIAFDPGLLELVDYIAQCEHRSRSDLVRQAMRDYITRFNQKREESRTLVEK